MVREAAFIEHIPANESEFGGFDPDLEESFSSFREDVIKNQAEITLRVFKLPADERGNLKSNGSHINLFSTPIDVYTLDEIIDKVRNEYMEDGERQIFVRLMANRKGKRGMEMNRVISIAKPLSRRVEKDSTPKESMSDLLLTFQRITEQNQQRTEAMMSAMFQRMQAPAVPPTDPIDLTVKLMTAMGGMMAVIQRPAAAGSSLLEQVQVLQSLKDLTGGGGDDDRDSRETNTQDVLVHGLKALPQVLQAISNAQSPQSPQRPQIPPHNQIPQRPRVLGPGIAPPNPVQNLTAGDNEVLNQIAPHLENLLNFAAQNADTNMIAEMVVEQLPEALDEKVIAFLSHPKVIERLCLFNGKISAHREWFAKLIQSILAQYEPADGVETGVVNPAAPV